MQERLYQAACKFFANNANLKCAVTTVVLYGCGLLFLAFVVPRLVTMGLLGVERSLVTALLGFEELLTQALFAGAKWVGPISMVLHDQWCWSYDANHSAHSWSCPSG